MIKDRHLFAHVLIVRGPASSEAGPAKILSIIKKLTSYKKNN